ncbi:hypothetical protein E2C01_023498 [Portunus trituberculatus]|uniref:Uncharacterized protein n=1 Tax=Portunus trituberculatus TaxID=210409 RepID=A0A5B7E8Z9_PORTR|nr:hypothetical protein [Portunus trituberculatus]
MYANAATTVKTTDSADLITNSTKKDFSRITGLQYFCGSEENTLAIKSVMVDPLTASLLATSCPPASHTPGSRHVTSRRR